jgi:predicted kinase
MRPTLLLVGGTHGAGKTTLADILATRLNWTVVSRDRVRAGMAWTVGEQHHVAAGDLSKRAVSVCYEVVAVLLERGSSVIAESGFRRGMSEHDLRPFESVIEVPLDLDVPLLTVRTADGYEPGLDAIEAFAREVGAPGLD